MITQQVSTSTAATGVLTSSNVKPVRIKFDSLFEQGTFIRDWLHKRQWIKESNKFGKTRTCRICDKKLKREEHYLHLDQRSYRAGTTKGGQITSGKCPIQISVCTNCVDNWSKELHKLNNDLQRNSTSEC